MDGGHRKRVAGNMEVGDSVGGEVGREASARRVGLQRIIEANGGRIV